MNNRQQSGDLQAAAEYQQAPVLVVGDGKLAFSLTVCLLQAGHPVLLYTQEPEKARECICRHGADSKEIGGLGSVSPLDVQIIDNLTEAKRCKLVVAITGEYLVAKQSLIRQLEQVLPADTLIAITTESISLSLLQAEATEPARIIGANWVEPAHTTYFLEIIRNDQTNPEAVKSFYQVAQMCWQKDPYVVKENGIRARLMGALVREAFYLVENGYVGVEDIDRACRNDAGYYLPFAGNFRYMDLMGTYAYGMVMQDLNPELSQEQNLPVFFNQILENGGRGMENNTGIYNYPDGEVARWEAAFRQFSYQIKALIQKYPFNYSQAVAVTGKVFS